MPPEIVRHIGNMLLAEVTDPNGQRDAAQLALARLAQTSGNIYVQVQPLAHEGRAAHLGSVPPNQRFSVLWDLLRRFAPPGTPGMVPLASLTAPLSDRERSDGIAHLGTQQSLLPHMLLMPTFMLLSGAVAGLPPEHQSNAWAGLARGLITLPSGSSQLAGITYFGMVANAWQGEDRGRLIDAGTDVFAIRPGRTDCQLPSRSTASF